MADTHNDALVNIRACLTLSHYEYIPMLGVPFGEVGDEQGAGMPELYGGGVVITIYDGRRWLSSSAFF